MLSLDVNLKRWEEHVNDLYNKEEPKQLDTNLKEASLSTPANPDINSQPPSDLEVSEAIRKLSNDKAAGPDGICAEMIKAGGQQERNTRTGSMFPNWKRLC